MAPRFSYASLLRCIISTGRRSTLQPRFNHHFSLESSAYTSQRTKALNGVPRRMNIFCPGSSGYSKTCMLGLPHLVNHTENSLARLPSPYLVSRRFFNIDFDFDFGGEDNGSDPSGSSDSSVNSLTELVALLFAFLIILVVLMALVQAINGQKNGSKAKRENGNKHNQMQSDQKEVQGK